MLFAVSENSMGYARQEGVLLRRATIEEETEEGGPTGRLPYIIPKRTDLSRFAAILPGAASFECDG